MLKVIKELAYGNLDNISIAFLNQTCAMFQNDQAQ